MLGLLHNKMKKKKYKIEFKIFLAVLLAFGAGYFAHAYDLATPIPGVGGAPGVKSVNSFAEYVIGVMPYLYGLAAVLAVVQLVIGGMQHALSEGLTNKQEAKERIYAALWGLAI